MAGNRYFTLAPRRDQGYDVVIFPEGVRKQIYPLKSGKAWWILGDVTDRRWPTPDEAAEEVLRQYEAMKAGG